MSNKSQRMLSLHKLFYCLKKKKNYSLEFLYGKKVPEYFANF